MNRRRMGAVALLLVLIALLLSSWVYLYDVDLPFGEWGRPSDRSRQKQAEAASDNNSTFHLDSDAVEGGPDHPGTRGNRPLEMPDEPRRVTPPPEPMEIPRAGGDETAGNGKESVEAELKAGEAGVAGAVGNLDLEPFIVSTHTRRSTAYLSAAANTLGNSALIKLTDQDSGLSLRYQQEFGYLLQGVVKFPELDKEARARLTEAGRMEAWVYTPEFPDFYFPVHSDYGNFVLQLTDAQAKAYRQKGLTVHVHSPAFRLRGGGESVTLKKVGEQLPEIALELAPVFKLVVRVTPQGAVDSGVRAWVERRGVDCPIDDSLFMSAKVPPSGELVFHVPEHYGELRVGVNGAEWHSGLPQLVKFTDWSRDTATVRLDCAAEPCDRITGTIGALVKKPGGEELPPSFQAGGIARLEDTIYGAILYSGTDGSFDGMFPYSTRSASRQLIVTSEHYMPRAVPLDGSYGEESTAMITNNGRAPFGPWQISREWKMKVDLLLPEFVGEDLIVTRDRSSFLKSGDSTENVELNWGSHLLTVRKNESLEVVARYWISDDAWEDALRNHNAGRTPNRLRLMKFEDYVRKQSK